MKILYTLLELNEYRNMLNPAESVGLVTTMGNLHDGHLSLIHQAKKQNEHVIVSIFVNPTQFNNANDYACYPKTLEADLDLLKQAFVSAVFLPEKNMLYPDNYTYQVRETDYSTLLEGAARPGHFDGVLTIVMKLFNLCRPKYVYFGEKDFQQYQLIKGMIDAFFMPIEIVLCKTIRHESSLALSSRNNRLTPDNLKKAELFARIFHEKTLSSEDITAKLINEGFQVDYIKDHENRRFAAVFVDEVRLIDNYELNSKQN